MLGKLRILLFLAKQSACFALALGKPPTLKQTMDFVFGVCVCLLMGATHHHQGQKVVQTQTWGTSQGGEQCLKHQKRIFVPTRFRFAFEPVDSKTREVNLGSVLVFRPSFASTRA